MVDLLPFIETKEKSQINFSGEVAGLIPGHNKAIDVAGDDGASYIDDFEGSQSAIDIRTFNNWVLSSLPQGQPDLFPEASLYNDLNYGKNRAKLSWYVIDPSIFYVNNSLFAVEDIPDSIKNNHNMRQILITSMIRRVLKGE